MIIPYLRGVISFFKAPVTWLLLLINTVVLVLTMLMETHPAYNLWELLADADFLKIQSQQYSEYILDKPYQYSSSLVALAEASKAGDSEKQMSLGKMAFRDGEFLKDYPDYKFSGDVVATSWWSEKLTALKNLKKVDPTYALGLSRSELEWPRWITYQFAHGGFIHFAGNMAFLLIFGSLLEPIFGSLLFLLVYLGSGVIAAGSFLFLSAAVDVPLVGASGAISGLMGLFCALFWQKKVPYLYFLFIPQKKYAGIIMLPAWITLVMWSFADLAGIISTMPEFGGVAHGAHLGGQLAGVVLGAMFVVTGLWKDRQELLTTSNKSQLFFE